MNVERHYSKDRRIIVPDAGGFVDVSITPACTNNDNNSDSWLVTMDAGQQPFLMVSSPPHQVSFIVTGGWELDGLADAISQAFGHASGTLDADLVSLANEIDGCDPRFGVEELLYSISARLRTMAADRTERYTITERGKEMLEGQK